MHEFQFQFEWDDVKAAANVRKHGVSFDLARTIFGDPFLLTVSDLQHSDTEERWFSLGRAVNGSMLAVAYLWFEAESVTRVRVISARQATRTEIHEYEESI